MAGHVDHGKSTIIGRLLVETGALPKGKLEAVRAVCRRNAKPFEYAFLLDALKDEQAQGITIDAARCFFKTGKRRYVLIDAPGHLEFLKNMITGASRAEAAFLVIDAQAGIQENTKRHGYMLSMLGLRQLAVLVNKMDLVQYREEVFNSIRAKYTQFLERVGITPVSFIPVSGTAGINISAPAAETAWYDGPTVLDQIDRFQMKKVPETLPFRFPVQDIYKFTEQGDERRILAGTVATGSARVGDLVNFLPSGKQARIKTIEMFNAPKLESAAAGQTPGFTLENQIYVRPGELMVKEGETPPQESARFRVNLFWMGRAPMIKEKTYRLKLGACRSPVRLVEVLTVLDASELTSITNKQQVDRHDVAECILECPKPVAFDVLSDFEQTNRLVIVDNYEIAGAGVILASAAGTGSILKDHIRSREIAWKNSAIQHDERIAAYGHDARFVVFTSEKEATGEEFARALERKLFALGFKAYYLGMENVARGLDADLRLGSEVRDEHIRRLGELARILTDAGQIFITSLAAVDDYDLKTLELLNSPNEILVINVGENSFSRFVPQLNIAEHTATEEAVERALTLLRQKKVIVDYQI